MKHLTILLTLLLATSVWAITYPSLSPNAKALICKWEKEFKTYDYNQPSSLFLIDADEMEILHIDSSGNTVRYVSKEFFSAWEIGWVETDPYRKFLMSLNRETLVLKMSEEISGKDGKLKDIKSNTALCKVKSAQALIEEINERNKKNWKEFKEAEAEQKKKNKI